MIDYAANLLQLHHCIVTVATLLRLEARAETTKEEFRTTGEQLLDAQAQLAKKFTRGRESINRQPGFHGDSGFTQDG